MLVLPLNDRHNRKSFDCGDADLNSWLKQTARQHKEKGVSSTFVSVSNQTSVEILGFYAISLAELVNTHLPVQYAKHSAVDFYQRYGFEQMADHPQNLFLPV